jgi:hypothetical protein
VEILGYPAAMGSNQGGGRGRAGFRSGGGPARPNGAGVSPRVIAAVLATAVLSVFALPGGPAEAAGVDVTTRPAAGSPLGPAVRLAARAFPAGARFVAATITARHAAGSSGRPLLLTATLTCAGESIQATTNVLTTAVLTARRVMRDATGCTVQARAAVDHPAPGDTLRVTATIAAAPVGRAAVGYAPDSRPTLMRPGQRADAAPAALAGPVRAGPAGAGPAGAGPVTVTGDLKVTTCTSVGGSRENGSPYLCAAARVRPGGSTLRVSLVVQQIATGGGYCAVRTIASRTVRVDRRTHHAMVAQSGSYTPSTARGCASGVRAKLYVQVLSGADVVIHRRATIVNVFR